MEPVFRTLDMAVEARVPIVPNGPVEEISPVMRSDTTESLRAVQNGSPRPAGAFWVPRRLGGGAPTPAEPKSLDQVELAERAGRRGDRQ